MKEQAKQNEVMRAKHVHRGEREIETSVINISLGCLLMGLYSVLCYSAVIATKNEFLHLRIVWVGATRIIKPHWSEQPTED